MAKSRTTQANQQTTTQNGPMIVERVNQIPIVNLAVTAGFTQYDKLKSSNVTVGGVISQAEKMAAYLWSQVQPVVNKLQDPIDKADKLACKTLDYVEASVPAIKKSPQEIISDSKSKYSQVVEQNAFIRIIRSLTEILYGSAIAAKDVIVGGVQQHNQEKKDQQQQPQQHQAEHHHHH